MGPSSVNGSSADTSHAFGRFKARERLISKSSAGTTGKGLTVQVGSLMSNAGKWFLEERLFAITGVGILCSAVIFALIIGGLFGKRWEQSRYDRITFENRTFVMVGLSGQTQESGTVIFVPVYREVK